MHLIALRFLYENFFRYHFAGVVVSCSLIAELVATCKAAFSEKFAAMKCRVCAIEAAFYPFWNFFKRRSRGRVRHALN